MFFHIKWTLTYSRNSRRDNYVQSPSEVKVKLFQILDDVLQNQTICSDTKIIRNIMEYIMGNITENNKLKIVSTLMDLIQDLPNTSKYTSKEFSEILKQIMKSREKKYKNKSEPNCYI